MTPQIDHLGKTRPVLRVSTHIYGVSQEIDGKTFIFRCRCRFLIMFGINCMVETKFKISETEPNFSLSTSFCQYNLTWLSEVYGKIYIPSATYIG